MSLGGNRGNRLRSPAKVKRQTFKVVCEHKGGVPPTPQPPFFTFKTKFNGEVDFEITQDNGSLATWYMGDGTIYANTNSVTHTYHDNTEKTVSISVGGEFSDVVGLGDFSNKDITFFDASDLSELSGTVNFDSNSELTSFLAPTLHNGSIFELNLDDCDITGTLSIGALNITNNLYAQRNSNLVGVSVGSGFACHNVSLNECDITGILDFSPIATTTLANGNWYFNDNPNLTGFTQPSSQISNRLTGFYIQNCDITGSLEVSNFYPGGFGRFYTNDNPNLTGLVFSAVGSVTGNAEVYRFHNCNLTGVLDMTFRTKGLDGSNGTLSVDNNVNLTGITFGSGQTWKMRSVTGPGQYLGLSIINTGITAIDLSPLTRFSGTIIAQNNPSLLSFTPCSSNNSNSQGNMYFVDNPNLSGTLDLQYFVSGGTGTNGVFNVYNNGAIDTLHFPKGNFGSIIVRDTDCTTFDLTGISHTNANTGDLTNNTSLTSCVLFTPLATAIIDVSATPSLVDLSFSTLNSVLGQWPNKNNASLEATGCSLSAGSIDKLLVDYDNAALNLGGGESAEMNLSGGANAAPTDGSITGFDGIAAKASINALTGHTAITN